MIQDEGSKILFEYFTDVLINDEPNKLRKCCDVTFKPIRELQVKCEPHQKLIDIFQSLKKVGVLEITNLIKFVKLLL